jgi:hypothetical protein
MTDDISKRWADYVEKARRAGLDYGDALPTAHTSSAPATLAKKLVEKDGQRK